MELLLTLFIIAFDKLLLKGLLFVLVSLLLNWKMLFVPLLHWDIKGYWLLVRESLSLLLVLKDKNGLLLLLLELLFCELILLDHKKGFDYYCY